MEDKIIYFVNKILGDDKSGHNMKHILNVKKLALKFCEGKDVNKDVVVIAALLHDVDDYKIVGEENAEDLFNARMILNFVGIDKDTKKDVLSIISSLGYKNRLKGIKPSSMEGMIVSDADMCDAIGSVGIIRAIVYAMSNKGNGVIFDKDVFPNTKIRAYEYNVTGTTHKTDNAINHFFEKLLKIPNLLLTDVGRLEGKKRMVIMIYFLKEYFRENDLENWQKFLNDYLEDNYALKLRKDR